jgi:hypothetical protein
VFRANVGNAPTSSRASLLCTAAVADRAAARRNVRIRGLTSPGSRFRLAGTTEMVDSNFKQQKAQLRIPAARIAPELCI